MNVVETTGGRIRGTAGQWVHSFLGIPYGTAERFRLAEPATWDGTFEATRFGPSSPPTLTPADRAFFRHSTLWREYAGYDHVAELDEDCLRLNVWTPALDGRARPVIFWLHGGGFSWGSGSGSWTWGDRLAARHDVVVVTINHRLGVLGYLDIEDAIGGEWRGSGVAGLVDLRLGLEWVRDNIERFGGNPTSVTIAGHSGGGAKVASLLALPSAEGLFVRAVIQSGVVSLRTIDREEATATAVSMLHGAGGVDGLRTMPVDDLTALAGAHRFRPVARTTLLPDHPFDPVAAPSAARVPLLIGTTVDDAAAFKFDSDPSFPRLDDDGLREWVARHAATDFGELADEVIAAHRAALPDVGNPRLISAIATTRLRERTQALIDRKLGGGDAPVHTYLFAYRAPMPPGTLFAGEELAWHGLELPFVFDRADLERVAGNAPERLVIARHMSACWASFARSGDPGWPVWDAERRLTMIFDRVSEVVRDPYETEQQLYDRVRGDRWTTSASS